MSSVKPKTEKVYEFKAVLTIVVEAASPAEAMIKALKKARGAEIQVPLGGVKGR